MADDQIRSFIEAFSKQFYFQIIKDPAQLMGMYHDQSQFSIEGNKEVGKENIVGKHIEKFSTSEFVITTSDGLLVSENEMSILVVGQLKDVNQEKPLGFTHSFVLHKIGDAWAITNEIFRLNVHNF